MCLYILCGRITKKQQLSERSNMEATQKEAISNRNTLC